MNGREITMSNGRTRFAGSCSQSGCTGKFQDHFLVHTWPTDVNKYAPIVGRIPRARGLGVMTLP